MITSVEVKAQIDSVVDKLYKPEKLAAMIASWKKYQIKMKRTVGSMGFKYNENPERDEFIKCRIATIGGSTVPIILESSSFMTPVELFMQKTLHKSTLKKDEPSEQMMLGNDMESGIIKAYKRVTGKKVCHPLTSGFMDRLPWFVGNVDGLSMGHDDGYRVLECKIAGAFSDRTGEAWGKENEYALEHDKIVQTIYSDLIPKPYLYQCMTYMMIEGSSATDLAVYHGANQLKIYTIPFDIKIATEIIRKCTAFMFNNIMRNVAPKHQNINDINAIYSNDDGETITASPELMDLRIELMALKEDKKAVEIELEGGQGGVMGRIKLAIGDAQCIVDPNNEKILSWKNQFGSRFMKKEFGNDHPELYAEYVEKTETRVLRIHKTREEKKAAKRAKNG